MATVRGTVSWGIQPFNWSNSNAAGAFWQNRYNFMKSVNDPLKYQVQWFVAGLTEGVEPSAGSYTSAGAGDLVSVIFTVQVRDGLGLDWREIGVIKKSRDIASRHIVTQNPANGHRFTVDVSALVADELSYSLCPINKGTWQTNTMGFNQYGGMNGGLVNADNVLGNSGAAGSPVSYFNQSPNGTMTHLRVVATYEVVKTDGSIVSASGSKTSTTISVINSVNQFEEDTVYYEKEFLHNSAGVHVNAPRRFNTRCPNWYWDDDYNEVSYNKPVRMDEQAEFLQWYVSEIKDSANPTEYYNYSEIYGRTFTANGISGDVFVLADFNSLLDDRNHLEFEHQQDRMLIQNVSPDFINNNAFVPQTGSGRPYTDSISPITASTYRYSLYFRGRYYNNATSAYINKTHSATNWYQIDREDENIPYGFVRFHWLNSMGGIDSYTAKRDVVEGLTISRDVVERKSADRTWYQDGKNQGSTMAADTFISDSMRGGNIYKGGREVTNVNAEKNKSVYTEPLNKSTAKWLKEIILSPNVWIEMDTDATKVGNVLNSNLRPSTKGYIPVIITNSDIETVNQENGLVTFNIEYALAHKVQTQRN